ncbi:FAD-dependent monooxygenase [Streptomyces violaceusniger]|uniref:FAD-dependent monooxygenase n=1 Tax=Streptomyces violaceusniger TaxID=68280 RepID=UPI0037FA2072
MQRTDVIVVGAGPTGLFLAGELALLGARVTVLERLPEPDPTIKAGSINVASAEILDRRGLLPAAEDVQRRLLASVGAFAGRKNAFVNQPDSHEEGSHERTSHEEGSHERASRERAASRSPDTSRACCSAMSWSIRATRYWPGTPRRPTASSSPSTTSNCCSRPTAPVSA